MLPRRGLAGSHLALLGLVALLLGLGLLGVTSGELPLSGRDVFGLIAAQLGIGDSQINDSLAATVFWELRLPRVVLTILVGAVLAMSGAVMQGLFRNPLADPGLLGISAGCALGAAIVMVLGAGMVSALAANAWSVPLGAFAGGLLATLLVYRLGQLASAHTSRTDAATMLLAGVAINAIAGAGTSALKYLAGDEALRGVVFWMMGDLGNAGWGQLFWAAPMLIGVMALLFRFAASLNALLLGESEARQLGFSVQRIKYWLIVLVALGVGIAVSLTGVIGFVGLLVPHAMRRWLGADHRILLPASMLAGAALLLAADWLARSLAAPAIMPIGVLTALLGGPFFIAMLLNRRWQTGA